MLSFVTMSSKYRKYWVSNTHTNSASTRTNRRQGDEGALQGSNAGSPAQRNNKRREDHIASATK